MGVYLATSVVDLRLALRSPIRAPCRPCSRVHGFVSCMALCPEAKATVAPGPPPVLSTACAHIL